MGDIGKFFTDGVNELSKLNIRNKNPEWSYN